MNRFVSSCLSVVFFLLLLSCAGAPKHFVYKSGKEWVQIRPVHAVESRFAPFSHPAEISKEEIGAVLSTLHYSHTMFVSLAWSKPLPVLNHDQQEVLANFLVQAFAKAGPQEEVAFSLRKSDKTSRETRARVFFASDGMHFIFDHIDRPSYWRQDTSNRGEAKWKLVPGEAQRLHATRSGGKGEVYNWLVVPVHKEAIAEE